MNEKEYAALKEELESISVPKEALSYARANGLRRAKKRQSRKKWTISLAVTTAFVLIFVTSIRVSPAFAQAVAKIPGFAPLVEMIAYDKGIEDILNNDYYEKLAITETKNGLTLTLLGIIADESGMIINYQLEAPYDIHKLDTKNVEIKQNGENLEAGLTYSWFGKEPTNHIEEIIEITSNKELNYANPNFELNITFKDKQKTAFTIPFTLQKEIAKSKDYKLDKKIEIDGQKFTLKSLKISPLRAKLDISLDPTNTMQILKFNSMELLDETGEEWGTIQNGISGFGTERDGEVSYLFQSNYFREPESLTLKIDDVQALPKGKDYIEVDFEKKEVVYIPKAVDLELEVVGNGTFNVTYRNKSPNHLKQMFFQAVDANGENVDSNGSGHRNGDDLVESTYTFNTIGKTNPIRIYFNSYDNYLKGSADVTLR